jgi:hypothetical protein
MTENRSAHNFLCKSPFTTINNICGEVYRTQEKFHLWSYFRSMWLKTGIAQKLLMSVSFTDKKNSERVMVLKWRSIVLGQLGFSRDQHG